ncbi:alanine--tRNA ligase [Patescibacteria group bacterium]|nr:alanine--tRNA ligase [Patescibacteria group bacterium]
MNSSEIRKKFIGFYTARGHVEIPSAPLVPANDPTTLFVSAGMQPLIRNILGEPHPLGKRLVNSQKAVRLQDIEEVGDNRHTTFFEMLGNWSFGDYFKKEQLPWVFAYLTGELGLDPHKLFVSVFAGNGAVPKDTESIRIWKDIFARAGIDAGEGERVFAYPAKNNWWSRAGEPDRMPAGEPGGPDSEVFYDFGQELRLHERSPYNGQPCHPNCDCGRYLEIANSVFMQYQKQADGSLSELSQKNVDFGGGLERQVAAANGTPDVFDTDLFRPVIRVLERAAKRTYGREEHDTRAMRIIADHVRGAVMMLSDGVGPSNKQQGYILRRLIRRALLYGRELGLSGDWRYVGTLAEPVAEIYDAVYPEVRARMRDTKAILEEEAVRFGRSLEKGLHEIEKLSEINGQTAFTLYETYGFPWEMTVEIAEGKGQHPDRRRFEEEFEKHKALSRTAAAGMFRGGLADQGEETTKLHTAHHLLLAALQQAIDPSIRQRGSNITAERLRMDFNFGRKLTPDELSRVENLVNDTIRENLPVTRVEMDRAEAETIGAQMEFGHKYPDRVSVYYVGSPEHFFSAEFCGGPHVAFTGRLGHFTIQKEESAGAGIRRMYARLTPAASGN